MVPHRSRDVLRASRYAFHGFRGLAVNLGDYQGDIVCLIHHSFAPATRRGVTFLWKLTTLSSEGKSTVKQLAEESLEGMKAANTEVVVSA